METREFVKKIDNGEAKVLTLEAAKALKGKKIYWMYFGYRMNTNVVNEMTVGEIVTEYDFNKTQPMKGYASRADYWDSYMDDRKKAEKRRRLLLLDADGSETYAFCDPGEWFDEPTFVCSDSDRQVFYLPKEAENE